MVQKKLIILTTSLSHGGAEKHGVLLADYFKNELNWTVQFLVFREGTGYLRPEIEKAGIAISVLGEVSKINPKRQKKEIKEKSKLLDAFEPDVIISLNREANIFNAFLWRATGAKAAFWSQQSTFDNEGMAADELSAMKEMSGYLSNSKHGLEYLIDSFGIDEGKGFVIYNGYERNKVLKGDGNIKEGIGLAATDFCALMVGHIAARKDHWTLIKSWPIVKEMLRGENITAKLLLAGAFGEETGSMIEYCVEKGIYDDVKFLGRFKNVAELNLEVDLGILSSHREGMPNVLVEQMMAGLPVVVSNIPGNLEAVGESNYNYAFEHENAEDLADKVVMFARDETLRKLVGSANQKYAQERFSIEKLGTETAAVINKILEQ